MVDVTGGSTPERRLRAAVIGTGFVGPFHVDAVRRGGYADVVAIAGSNADRTAERARGLGVESWTTDVPALLRDPSIDVIHVCTPNRTHVDLARAAIEAGKHVVVEKPLALEAGAARSLAELARSAGRHGATTFTYRGYPMVRRARGLVAAGGLGELRLVHGAYIQDWLADAADYNWRIDPDVGGESRAVADIGSHWFDTVEFISGRRVASVFADFATFIPRRRRALGGSVAFAQGAGPTEEVEVGSEDAATILFRFEGGGRATCAVSQVSPGRKNAMSIEMSGASATLSWEQEKPEQLWLRTREKATLYSREPGDGLAAGGPGVPSLPAGHPEGWAEALRDVLRPFYAAVASGAPVPPAGRTAAFPTLDDGARAVAFVDATIESARSGRWVPLPG